MSLILVFKGALDVISTAELVRQSKRDTDLSISILDDLTDADIVQANDHLRSAFAVSVMSERRNRIEQAANCYTSAYLKQIAAYRRGMDALLRRKRKILGNLSLSIAYMLQATVCYVLLNRQEQVSVLSRRLGTLFYHHYLGLRSYWDCKVETWRTSEELAEQEVKLRELQEEERHFIDLLVALGHERWQPVAHFVQYLLPRSPERRLFYRRKERYYLHTPKKPPAVFTAPELKLPKL